MQTEQPDSLFNIQEGPYISFLLTQQDLMPELFAHEKSADSIVSTKTYRDIALSTTHKQTKEGIPNTIRPNYFPFLIIVIASVLIIISKRMFWRSFGQLFESFISIKKFRLWLRDTSDLLRKMYFLTIPAYMLVFSLALDLLIEYFLGNQYLFSFLRYGMLLLGVVAFNVLRFLLMKVGLLIFNSSLSTLEQIRNIQVINSVLLIMLIPPVTLFSYNNDFKIYALFIALIIIIMEIYRLVRSVISAISLKEFSVYYFFLYFCTVEILPVMFIIKLFQLM
jgi:hypothetical protein